MKNFDVLIIGGGAAGLTAAVFSARAGKSAAIICPDKIGHKLSITGKGRCNLTNNCDNETVMKNLPKGGRFMFSALSAFSPADTMAFFEGLGVPLKTERGRRVFPVSDRAWDVVDALKRELARLRVPIISERAVEILTEEELCTLSRCQADSGARPEGLPSAANSAEGADEGAARRRRSRRLPGALALRGFLRRGAAEKGAAPVAVSLHLAAGGAGLKREGGMR